MTTPLVHLIIYEISSRHLNVTGLVDLIWICTWLYLAVNGKLIQWASFAIYMASAETLADFLLYADDQVNRILSPILSIISAVWGAAHVTIMSELVIDS